MTRHASRIGDRADLPGIEEAAAYLETRPPHAALRWAFEELGDRVAIATGFGLEGVAVIDMAANINPRVDVLFVDTGFHFPETYALRRRLEARYGISIRAVEPSLDPVRQEEVCGAALWARLGVMESPNRVMVKAKAKRLPAPAAGCPRCTDSGFCIVGAPFQISVRSVACEEVTSGLNVEQSPGGLLSRPMPIELRKC